MLPIPKVVIEFTDVDGRNPFRSWFSSFKDIKAQAIIDARLTRVRLGNFGHCRSVGLGVMELKIDFGPGYRVYFSKDGDEIIVLLAGGVKKTQAKDIKRAQEYWHQHKGTEE